MVSTLHLVSGTTLKTRIRAAKIDGLNFQKSGLFESNYIEFIFENEKLFRYAMQATDHRLIYINYVFHQDILNQLIYFLIFEFVWPRTRASKFF